MNFGDFKEFTPADGERYIIVENGEPKIVLLSFKEYRKISSGNSSEKTDNQQPSESIKQEQAGVSKLASVDNKAARNVEDELMLEKTESVSGPEEVVEEREKLLQDSEDLEQVAKDDLAVEDLPF